MAQLALRRGLRMGKGLRASLLIICKQPFGHEAHRYNTFLLPGRAAALHNVLGSNTFATRSSEKEKSIKHGNADSSGSLGNISSLFKDETHSTEEPVSTEATGSHDDGDRKLEELSNEHDEQNTDLMLIGSKLKYLLNDYEKDVPEIKALEEMITPNALARCNISHVYNLYTLHKSCKHSTPLRRFTASVLLETLEKRWAEINTPNLLVSYYYLAHELKKVELVEKLVGKSLDLMDSLNEKNAMKIFILLGKMGQRQIHLLRTLSYQMRQDSLNLSPDQLSSLTYACAVLKYTDRSLLLDISKNLHEIYLEGNLNQRLALSFLSSFSFLGWGDTQCLDFLTKDITENVTEMKPHALHSLVFNCANLNHTPPVLKTNFPIIEEQFLANEELNVKHLVEFAWSAAVLKQQLSASLAATVLAPEFIKMLQEEGLLDSAVNKMRLQSINAAAANIENYNGPKLPDDFYVMSSEERRNQLPEDARGSLLASVLASLKDTAPADTFINQCLHSPVGCVIDVEMLVDNKGGPLPLDKLKVGDEQTQPSAETAPEGSKRLAIKVLNNWDVVLPSNKPKGHHAIAARHLARQGYGVVWIKAGEFKNKRTAVEKLKYLLGKLQEAAETTDHKTVVEEPSEAKL